MQKLPKKVIDFLSTSFIQEKNEFKTEINLYFTQNSVYERFKYQTC